MFDMISKLMSCHFQSLMYGPQELEKTGKIWRLIRFLYSLTIMVYWGAVYNVNVHSALSHTSVCISEPDRYLGNAVHPRYC